MTDNDPPQRNITCTICGREDVPDWDGQGHCIKDARDLVLGEGQQPENDGCSCGFWPCRHYPAASKQQYEADIAENIRLVASSELPANWIDPVSGKKLYNEAACVEREQAARSDQIEQDFLTYNVELDTDESELIAVRDLLQQQLAPERERNETE